MFYVYVDWTEEERPRAYYVGKGQATRLHDPVRTPQHLDFVRRYGQQRRVHFETERESEALAEESRLIKELRTLHGVEGNWGANLVVGSGPSANFARQSPYQKQAAVHVKLPLDVHRRFRARAFELDTTMQLVFESAARAFADGDEHVTALVKRELERRR